MERSVKIDIQRDPNVLQVLLGVSVVALLAAICIMFEAYQLVSLILMLSFGGVVLYSRIGGELTAADDGVVLSVPMKKPTVIPYYKIKDVRLDIENRGKIVTGFYKGTTKYAYSISIVTSDGTYTYSCLNERKSEPTALYLMHDELCKSSPFAGIEQQIRMKSNI